MKSSEFPYNRPMYLLPRIATRIPALDYCSQHGSQGYPCFDRVAFYHCDTMTNIGLSVWPSPISDLKAVKMRYQKCALLIHVGSHHDHSHFR